MTALAICVLGLGAIWAYGEIRGKRFASELQEIDPALWAELGEPASAADVYHSPRLREIAHGGVIDGTKNARLVDLANEYARWIRLRDRLLWLVPLALLVLFAVTMIDACGR